MTEAGETRTPSTRPGSGRRLSRPYCNWTRLSRRHRCHCWRSAVQSGQPQGSRRWHEQENEATADRLAAANPAQQRGPR